MTEELTPRPRPWDLPVVRALDAIELLHGLDPGRVEFDQFRFHGVGMYGPMQSATIHAFQPVTSVPYTVKFEVRGSTYMVEDHDHRPLSVSGVADLLHLPLASADRAVTLLKQGLTESLQIYNQAHAPALRRSPASATRDGQPWPFAARPGPDEPSQPAL